VRTSLPFFRMLTPEDVKKIDRTGRRILEHTGIKVLDSGFLDVLKAAGAQVDYEVQRVRFPEDVLDELLSRAPSRFTLCSRDGKNDIHLGEGKTYFANGGRVFRLIDMVTGGNRLTLLRDVALTATLVHNLEHIRFYIIACQANDIKPVNYHLLDFYHAMKHTTKHIMGGCDDLRGVKQMWKLARIVAGGENKLREKPFVSVIVNPISPLTLDATTLQILQFCATHGIPVTFDSAPIAGATAPVTLGGTLSQMHAEALAGVAIAQIFSLGAKVLYGTVPSTMDLRNMEFSMGSAEMTMMNTAAVQLAKHYNLPSYASGGLTDAKMPEIQAGIEEGFSNLLVAMAGADCVHLAAGILDSGNSISYEQFVIDNEIIGMIHRILAGIQVDEATLGFDVIDKVGPGGNYVMEDHTVEHMMDEFFYPDLTVRCNFDIWEQRGRPDMLSRANELVHTILRENTESLLDVEVIDKIKTAFPGSRML